MANKKWYNWKMSRISQKPSWQSSSEESDYAVPENSTEGKKVEMISNNDVQQNQSVNSGQESGLDVNLIISSFQEKLAQLTTELVVKDATIKQLTNIINNMRGQK
jgi:hypothetical protein